MQENIDFLEVSAHSGFAVETTFRRIIFSIARLIPDVIVHLDLNGLPSGWISCPFPQLQRAQTSSYVVTSSRLPPSESPPAGKDSPEQTNQTIGCCSAGGESNSTTDGNNSNNSSNSELILSLNHSGSDQDAEENNPENFSLSRSRRRSCSIELTGLKEESSPKSSPRNKSVSADESFVDPFMDIPSVDAQDNFKCGSNPPSPRSPLPGTGSPAVPAQANTASNYPAGSILPPLQLPPSSSSSSSPSSSAAALSIPRRDVLLKKSFSSSLGNSKLKPTDLKPLSRAVSYSSHQIKRGGNSSPCSTYIPPAACGYLNYWTGEVQLDYPKDAATPHLIFAARRTTSLQGQQMKDSLFE